MSSRFLRTRLVSKEEFWREFRVLGAIYFIRNDRENSVKIGYSRDPWKRKSNLQVGSPERLRIVGLVAAPEAVEPILHARFWEYRLRGEWFHDNGDITADMNEMTFGEPWLRNVWTLVQGQEFFVSWDEATKTHTRHTRSLASPQWEPPLP
jgi:hypothetical protein